MKGSVVVVDYEMGNVQSVANAVELLGWPVRVTREPAAVEQASHLIVPGVGSFADGMRRLREQALDRLLEEQVMRRRIPFLGICLGMQVLAEWGEEGGRTPGLGWVPGRVRRLRAVERGLKLPHMGWNDVIPTGDDVLYAGIPRGSSFYFVHSYHLADTDPAVISGICDYGDQWCASLRKGHIFGTQFHPEKSQRDGLQVLKNFLEFSC
ncbi:MAG: imidazole glycerol phosphate synthase subunit HisH [Candidatus Omnitrophica bacterium]|nr:imidazole glycerol phosphate synthase subunit HisH [Candidatus Omnitrophota bacterium]